MLTVFPHDSAPFQISEGVLRPLERRALAKLEIEPATAIDTRFEPQGDPRVVNEPVGRFALWGFPSPPPKSQPQ
jgi:hypothetical protein